MLRPPTDACSIGTISRLYLGRGMPEGFVTEIEWRQFGAEVVTPRFPDGFTELSAHGWGA